MTEYGAQAIGIANLAMDGTVLDTWYPHPELVTDNQFKAPKNLLRGNHRAQEAMTEIVSGTVRLGAQDLSNNMLKLVTLDEDRRVEQVAVHTTIADLRAEPIDAHDVYLRLHLLSHRLVKPHELNMDGAVERLANVVWTNKGPCTPENFESVRTNLRSRGLIHVYSIDRLPRMVDYVVPSGVHIAEAERVRLGAYLAPGTVVQREGFVSYNSGSLGAARIEGRLSSAVVLGEGTHLELSASVLAGRHKTGGRIPVTIGEHCTFGVASGVIGLSLGDHCTIGANVILEPDTRVWDVDAEQLVRAAELQGRSHIRVAHEPGRAEPVVRNGYLL